MFIVLDTETTGIPTDYYGNFENSRLIQIAWIVFNKNYKIQTQKSYIINNNSYSSPEEILKIHNITEDMRIEFGKDFYTVINEFFNDVSKCKYIIAHGILFDISVVINECLLHDINYDVLFDKEYYNTKYSDNYIRTIALSGSVAKLLNCEISEIKNNLSYNLYYPDSDYKINLLPHDALFDCFLCIELFKNSKLRTSKFKYIKSKINLIKNT